MNELTKAECREVFVDGQQVGLVFVPKIEHYRLGDPDPEELSASLVAEHFPAAGVVIQLGIATEAFVRRELPWFLTEEDEA